MVTETDNGYIFRAYNEKIGVLSEPIAERISQAINEYSARKVFDAIAEAGKNNARSWAYVDRILKTRNHKAVRPDRDVGYFMAGKSGHRVIASPEDYINHRDMLLASLEYQSDKLLQRKVDRMNRVINGLETDRVIA